MSMSNRSTAGQISLILLVTAFALAACSPQSNTADQPAAEAAPAPSRSSEADDVKTFTVGEFSAMALRDGGLDFPNDNKTLGIGRTPAEVAALLAAAGAPTDVLILSIQPLLVKSSDRVLLFDTGAGTNMGVSGGGLPASMAAAGVDPQSITDVFISHAHGDHVGGLLNAQGTVAFPNAAIHISAPEWAFLKGMNAQSAANVGVTQHPQLVAAMEPRVAAFEPGTDIVAGVVKAVEIKGHTPGHSGYLITSGESSLLYIGDAAHHFVVSVQKPEWTINFDTDAPTSEASRSALLARSAESGQRIYAVHFPFPGVGKIERRAEGFVWVAE
jgi:glyoxylase-like metal-dependent hydrolase (beta-lactamase superfamily II)